MDSDFEDIEDGLWYKGFKSSTNFCLVSDCRGKVLDCIFELLTATSFDQLGSIILYIWTKFIHILYEIYRKKQYKIGNYIFLS